MNGCTIGHTTRLTSLVIFLSLPAFSQGTTAELHGTVSHEGAPLSGVTITIASPRMQGTRSTVSAINGAFLFPSIPPGDFTVTFEMEGMTTVTRIARLGLAKTEHVAADMELATVVETATVTAAAPSVLQTTEVQANFTATEIEELPLGRSIRDAFTFAPGVALNFYVSGASSVDSLYLINGAVAFDVGPGSLFIEDSIQETTVMTASISAEYGRFNGGVVSTITRSGGNEYSGSFRDSLSNAAWDTTTPAGEENQPSVLDETYEATLGGRFVRDRLWFFAAGRYAERRIPGFYAYSTTPRPDSVETDERWELKLTGLVTPKQSLVGSYLEADLGRTNHCDYGCWELSAVDIDGFRLPQSITTAHYTGIPINNVLLEASWSARDRTSEDYGGENRDRVYGTWAYDYTVGGMWGAPVFCGVCDQNEDENEYYVVKAAYYLATAAAGTHNIVAGYENFASSRTENNYQSGSDYSIYTYTLPEYDSDGTFRPVINVGDLLQWVPVQTLSRGSNFLTESIFLNDRWDLGSKWSFNIGVRYDANDGKDGQGHPISDDSNVSSRLGVIYDVKGDGRFRANASYSKYVTKIFDGFGDIAGGGNPSYFGYYYDGPKIGGAGSGLGSFDVIGRLFEWFDSIGGTQNIDHLVLARIPGLDSRFEGSLDSPNAEEITIGLGALVGSKGFVRIDYIDRTFKDFYGMETHPNDQIESPVIEGEFLDVKTYTNSNEVAKDYRAVQIQASYRLSDRLNVGGHYTWSETVGNGLGFNNPGAYREYTAFPQNNPVGVLLNDQTHKARLWISWDQSLGAFGGLNVSVLERYDSGAPYEAAQLVRVNLFVTNPGYATPPATANYFFSDRGAYRWEAASATDLALNWELPIRKAQLFVQGELINVFDESAVVSGGVAVSVRADRDPTTPGTQRFDPFTMMAVECVAGGPAVCDWTKSSSFGKPTGPDSYQQPLTYRVSAGVRF